MQEAALHVAAALTRGRCLSRVSGESTRLRCGHSSARDRDDAGEESERRRRRRGRRKRKSSSGGCDNDDLEDNRKVTVRSSSPEN